MTAAAPASPGHQGGARRSRVGAVRHRLHRRAAFVTGALAVVVAGLALAMLSLGSFFVSGPDVLASLVNPGGNPDADFVVRDLRLPTTASAVLGGAAFGAAGAMFQRLLGNPLASPDFVGVASGASLAAVSSIVWWNLGGLALAGAAFGGAVVTAAAVYVLAFRDGLSGYRFILIGIGVSMFLTSVIGFVLARARISDAQQAMTWLVGSVGQAGSGELRVLAGGVVVLLPLAHLLQRSLRALELGDDTAVALGGRVEASRRAVLAVAVVLVALATAACGPLAFVALLSGPLARRLYGPASGGVFAAALVGAAIVCAAELVSSQLLPSPLPTGVLTGAVGAPYLIWLIVSANRVR